VIDDPGSRRSRRRIRGHGVSRTARGRCGNRSGHLTHRGADADEPDAGEPAVDEPKDATIEADEEGESDESAEPEEVDPDATGESREPMDAAPATAPDEGLAAALAAEIRAGGVDDADLETLRSELDVGVPRSVDVRIARLQSSVADIEAYADALAEFIDGEGPPARSSTTSMRRSMPSSPRWLQSTTGSSPPTRTGTTCARRRSRASTSRCRPRPTRLMLSASASMASTDQIEGVDDRVEGVETDVSNVEESVTNLDGTVADPRGYGR